MDFKTRSLRLAVLGALAGVSLVAFGCEKQEREAEWKAQQEATAARPKGAKAINDIKPKLAGIATSEGTPESVLAHATIGDAEVLAANEPALAFRQSLDRSRKLAATIEDRAASAQRLLNAASSINDHDPKQSLETIAGFVSAGKGDGNANTFTLPGNTTLPSINALDQSISKITTSIASLESQIAALTDQRAKLLDKADKADRKAGTVDREERVKAVTQSANARNEAAKMSSQMDLAKSQLLHLRADLATHEAERKALTDGIASLNEQSSGLGAAWAEMNQHAAGLTSKAKSVLSSGEGSVTELSAALVTEITEADKTLKEADEHYDLAIKSYDSASGVARTLESNFGGAPNIGQRASFKTLVEAFPKARYDLNSAWTSMNRAKLHADYAAALADRKDIASFLANAAKASGYQVPDVLDAATIDKAMRAEITSADAYFQEAHNKFEDVAGSSRYAPLKNGAVAGRVANNYYRAMLSKLAGKIGGLDEIAAGEANYMKAARAALDEAVEAKLPMTVLPASLRAPVETPAEEGMFGSGEGSTGTSTEGATTEPTTQATPSEPMVVANPTEGEFFGDRVNFGTFSVQVFDQWTMTAVNEMQALVEFPDARVFGTLARNWRANIGDAVFTIAVLNAPVASTDVADAAKKFAEASKSELLEGTIDVAGETGYKLKGADLRTSNPTAGIFVVHKNTAYIIAGGRVNGDDAWKDLETFAASWKWIDGPQKPRQSGEGSFE